MNGDDLKSLLDEASQASSPVLSADQQGGRVDDLPSPSPTVLEMDRWGKRRGKEIAGRWAEFDPEEDYKETPSGKQITPAYTPEVVADAHSSLFDSEPRFAERPEDEARAAWWKQLMDTPEYQKLHNQTCLDSTMAELGAKHIYDQWAQYAADQPESQEGDPAPGSDEESLQQTLGRIRSTSQALQEASETVEAAKDAAAGLGLGDANGQIDPQELAEYFKRIREDSFLRDVMRMAGRMRTLCQALQRTKTVHGRDDTVGVEMGGDVSRLIPSELAQLTCGVDELELLALDRLARRQALCRKYRGLEKLGRGPIVVCVDESGSMNGQKIIAAKALALTMAWLARKQRRWIALVGFAYRSGGVYEVFPPGGMDQEALIGWLQNFRGGGTTLDVPLDTMPFEYWKNFEQQGLQKGKTDHIIITDAQVHCSEGMRDNYLYWTKIEQVRTYGIVIGQSDPGDLKSVCDQYWCIPSLDLDNPAVQNVLSI